MAFCTCPHTNIKFDKFRTCFTCGKAFKLCTTPESDAANIARQDDQFAPTPAGLYPVLGITELLEQFLVNLEHKDLVLGAKLTSKYWKECIEGSIISKKICFEIPDYETGDECFRAMNNPEIFSRRDSQTGLYHTKLTPTSEWKLNGVPRPRFASAVHAFFAATNEATLSAPKARKALSSGQISLGTYMSCLRILLALVKREDPDRSDKEIKNELLGCCWPSGNSGIHKTCQITLLRIVSLGYGARLVFLQDKYEKNSPFDIQDQLLDHLKRCQGSITKASWASRQVTRPASTTMHLLQASRYASWPETSRTIENDDGITVQQLLLAVIEILVTKTQSLSPVDWFHAFETYARTSTTIIDGMKLGPASVDYAIPVIETPQNLQVYKDKVLAQCEELQALVRDMF